MLTHVARNEELWDAFVLQHGGGFLQSWGWSQFQEAMGRSVFRFRVDEPGQIGGKAQHEDTFAQFLVLMHPLPMGQKYLYVPRGPVMSADKGSVHRRLETFTVTLRQAMRRHDAIFTRVEFPEHSDGGRFNADDLEALGFERVQPMQPEDTSIVDLTKDEVILLADMHQKTRYNIRLAERRGVTVHEANHANAHLLKKDIDVFWRLLGETSSRDRFHTHERRYYETMVDVLSEKKRGTKGMRVRLVFASYEGEAIAAGLFGSFGDTVTYLHGASRTAQRRVMAPHLLHWTVIKDAKRSGYTYYDFWGIAPTDDPSHKWAGITRFKRGFGGHHISYLGAWELPGKPIWYTLYRLAKRFRN